MAITPVSILGRVEALETKVGGGVSAPTDGTSLVSTVDGESSWEPTEDIEPSDAALGSGSATENTVLFGDRSWKDAAFTPALNVKHYGAVGDGVTDDSAAFEAAFAAGKHVVVPGLNGEVYIVERIEGVQSSSLVEGIGRPTLKLKPGSTASPMLLEVNGVSNVTFRNLVFDGNTDNIVSFNNVTLVYLSDHVTFDHCRWQNCEGIASYYHDNSSYASYLDCEFSNCGQSVYLVSGTLSDRKQALAGFGPNAKVNGCTFEDVGLDCISFGSTSDNARITNNFFDTNYAGVIYCSDVDGPVFIGNIILNGGGNGLDIINATNVTAGNNVIMGCGGTGIGVFNNCRGVTLEGNVCVNNAQDVASTHKGGITFHAETGTVTQDVTLSGNVCYDNQGPGSVTQRYAIGVVSPDGASAFRNIQINKSNLLTGYSAAGNPDDASVFQAALLLNPFVDVELVDHFMTGLAAGANTLGDLGWHASGTSTGTRSIDSPIAGRPGIVMINTAATSGSTSYLRLFNAGFGVFLPADYFDARFSFRLQDNDANVTMRVGMSNDGSSNPSTDGIYLEKLDADTQWFAVCRNASTETRSAALATCDTNWHQIRMRRVNATTIGFTLDSAAEVTISTNVPTAALQPFYFIANSAAANKRMKISRFRMTIQGLTV